MKYQTAAITVTQGDFLYIDEWIQYHHGIGVDLFLIAYNGKTSEMDKLPKYDYVKYFDFSINDLYVNKNLNRTGKEFSGIVLYKDFNKLPFMQQLHNILLETLKCCYPSIKYVINIDIDEFIDIKYEEYKNDITKFFTHFMPEDIPGYEIHMQYMTDNNQIFYENRPVLERFTEKDTKYKEGFRKTVWGGRHVNYKSVINIKHKDIMNRNLIIVSPHNISYQNINDKFDFDLIALNHYYTKSLEEYIWRFKKSDIDSDYKQRFNGRVMYHYFRYNKCTDDKLIAFRELLENNNIDYVIERDEKVNSFFLKRYKQLFEIPD